MIKIGKKEFKDSWEFDAWLSDAMQEFLENIQDYKIYTETDSIGSFPLSEYEENIQFYYTKKGMNLVDRWIRRMEKVYNYYIDDKGFERPTCHMYKEF